MSVDAGTPEPKPDDGVAPGTPDGQDDGSETVKLPKGVFKVWEEKAKNYNEVTAKLNDRDREIADLRARVSAASAPADRQTAWVKDLQERAPFDQTANDTLSVLNMAAEAKLESQLFREMHLAGVTVEEWPTVEWLVKQSGYQLPILKAREMAKGSKLDSVEAENTRLREEIEKLKKPSDRAPAAVSGAAATPPAAVGENRTTTIAKSQYDKLLASATAKDATDTDKRRAMAIRADLEATPPRAVLDWNA